MKPARAFIALTLVLLSVSCTNANDPSPQREGSFRALHPDLQRALEEGVTDLGVAGAQAAVAWPDGTMWTGSAGLADVEAGVEVTNETLFALGSMTKAYTAALVLDLAEDDVLDTRDLLSEWVPNFPGAERITLYQLLTHTSGLAQIAGSDIPAALADDPDGLLSFDDLQLEPVCRPGECYHYQSPDFGLLGEVVEEATGHSFAHELRTRLFEPLELDRSYFPAQEPADGPMATGYGFGPPTPAEEVAADEQPDVERPLPNAGGGILARASDVARFTQRLMTGGVLEGPSLDRLLDFDSTNGVPGTDECAAVGLGVVRVSVAGEEVWSHGGFTGNFNTTAPYFPQREITIVVLVNDGATFPAGPIAEDLAQIVQAGTEIIHPEVGGGFCNYDIYVARADGGGSTRLTTDPSADGGAPTWSPDGSRMLFVSERTGSPDIFVMDADGSGQTDLSKDPAADVNASWSPDGERIAFQSDRAGNNDIYVMDVDGKNVIQLTDSSADEISPAWSPDGHRIAYARGEPRQHDIWMMNADGSRQRRLTRGATDEWWPAWSPDGSRIAFMHDGISIVEVESGKVTQLSVPVEEPRFPNWSVDDQIAFVDLTGDLWSVEPDGSGLQRITETSAREFAPTWSPDGRLLAFPRDLWVSPEH